MFPFVVTSAGEQSLSQAVQGVYIFASPSVFQSISSTLPAEQHYILRRTKAGYLIFNSSLLLSKLVLSFPTIMYFTKSVAVAILAFTPSVVFGQSTGQNMVQLGAGGNLMFTPNMMTVNQGDNVTFAFMSAVCLTRFSNR